MPSLERRSPPLAPVMAAAAIALAALVGADELAPGKRMLIGFSLDVAHVRLSVEAEAADIKGE